MSLNPVALVVIAIVALIAAIVLAYNKSETFRNIVQAVFKAVADAVMVVVDIVGVVLPAAWKVVQAVVNVVINIIKGYINVYITIITTVIDLVKGGLTAAFEAFQTVATHVWQVIKAPIDAIWSAIKRVVDIVQDLIGFISNIKLPSLPRWVPFVGSWPPRHHGRGRHPGQRCPTGRAARGGNRTATDRRDHNQPVGAGDRQSGGNRPADRGHGPPVRTGRRGGVAHRDGVPMTNTQAWIVILELAVLVVLAIVGRVR